MTRQKEHLRRRDRKNSLNIILSIPFAQNLASIVIGLGRKEGFFFHCLPHLQMEGRHTTFGTALHALSHACTMPCYLSSSWK